METSFKIPTSIGRMTLNLFRYIGGMGYLVLDSLYWFIVAPFQLRGKSIRVLRLDDLFFQMVRFGFRALSIVLIVNFFIGLVLGLQLAYVLQQLGFQTYIPGIVSLTIFREMGPLVTAVIMSGFAGASIAAEIGTMEVSEEIMALKTSAIHPIRFLVVPRMLSALIVIPCLTIIANVIGVIGGAIIGVGLVGIDLSLYMDKTWEFLEYKDVLSGLAKSGVFALIIVALACYEGFRARGGAEGVGKATTNTVVFSIIAIIFLDAVATTIFFYVF